MDQNTFLDPLRDLLSTIARWLPQFIGALVVLLIGYTIAKAVEGIVKKLLQRANFDGFVHRGTAGSYVSRVLPKPSGFLGSFVFWLLWLAALSIGVRILGIPGLTDFVNAVYAYLPNVLAALLIFFVAGAVSTAVAGLANRVMGDTPTGKLVQTVVPALVMTISVFMILNQLGIARDIVNITYTALIGALALGLALAFGLGGRDVAAQMLSQAYDAGRRSVGQARSDAATGADRTRNELRDGETRTL